MLRHGSRDRNWGGTHGVPSRVTLRAVMLPFALLPVLTVLPIGPAAACADTTRAVALRTEFSQAPLGIDTPAPRLSWRIDTPRRGARQTAWRVLVASTPDRLARDEGDLWDSGRVATDATTLVPYGGAPLASSQQVFWKVRVWDEHGAASPWSESSTWTMGVLESADWKGAWITSPGASETVLLRRDFTVRPGLRRAVAHVSGLGQYEFSLNGTRVSEDLFTPGWTHFSRSTLYATHDVTAHLVPGANAAGVVLGNGMFNVVRRNRFAKFVRPDGPLRAILHLQLEYDDGATEVVGTDEAWRTHPGPETAAQIYGGEDFDARLVQAGWDSAGFDARRWTPAVAVIRVPHTLRGHSGANEPIRLIETRQPVAMRTFPDGTAVIDFGQNASFMPRLTVSGPAGSTVRLMPAEVLHPDGTINRNSMGGPHRGYSWWQYTKATDAPETWFPRFYYLGSRYVRAELLPAEPGGPHPSIDTITMEILHASAAPAGRFASSSTLYNRARELVRWAQRSNMVSVLTDCPHREKLGWLEQNHLNGPAIRYEFEMARTFTKGMRDMAEAQTPEGLVPNIAPELTRFNGTFRAAAEWGAAFLHVAWQQFRFNGDIGPMREHYPAMKRYFAYLESRAEDDILAEGLGDWFDIGPRAPGRPNHTMPPVTATAFYQANARLLADFATLLGHEDDARHFGARAEQIRQRYNREFFNPGTRSYATGSQCANALPLVLGIVEPEHRAAVLDAIIRDLEERDFAFTPGGVGFRFLLQALALHDRSDVIHRMINQDDKPGYGYQLRMGATALTEAWDANPDDSQNHFMLGHITEWFYKDLAGIDCDPAGPGFKRIIIRPQPVGELKWVEAGHRTDHGEVSVRWDRADDGVFTLRTTIPPNSTATILVPGAVAVAVTADGAPDTDPLVQRLGRRGDRTAFAVPAGTYRFRSSP